MIDIKMKNLRKWVAALLATSLSVACPASAFTGISFSGVTTTRNNVNFTYGYGFQVGATDISVDGLGFYDFGQDGLVTAHNVGLWTNDGALLTSVSVDAGTSASSFKFKK
jgi:hypothetical protein